MSTYEDLVAINGGEHFNPRKMADIRRIVYGKLGAPVTALTVDGKPSVRGEVLQALSTKDTSYGEFSKALIAWRQTEALKQ